MTILIPDLEGERFRVDRSGNEQEPGGPQGFYIYFGQWKIKFENELDAVAMAKTILRRMGERYP